MAYARGAVVTAARAFGLESIIDAACPELAATKFHMRLHNECDNGKSFGFTGKRKSAPLPSILPE